MRVCGEMALDQIPLFQTVKGQKSQSHSCFHGRMAVAAVILPFFFVPAAFNRRNTNMEEPKSKAKRGQNPLFPCRRIRLPRSRCRSCTTSPTTPSRCGTTRPCRKRRRASGSTAFSFRLSSVPVRTAAMRSSQDTGAARQRVGGAFRHAPHCAADGRRHRHHPHGGQQHPAGEYPAPPNGRRRTK